MARACCSRPITRIIRIGNVEAGLIGLDESLKNVYMRAIADEEEIRGALLKLVREFGNYIAPSRENEYQDALLREYKIYVLKAETERKKDSTPT
jgi:hypothetical protein